MTSSAGSDGGAEEKLVRLEEENRRLKKKIRGLKKTMEITTKHGDVVTGELEEKVEASIREIEVRVRMISETMPVPIIISQMADGKIRYVNEHSCRVFGLQPEDFLKYSVTEFYHDPMERKILVDTIIEKGRLENYEVRLKKWGGALFYAALYSQPLDFENSPCTLSVIIDLTEQKRAEAEIRRLSQELEKQKEIEDKYLTFTLAGETYGIHLLKVREIIGLMPVTPMPNAPDHIRGVIRLRDRILPVMDLRRRFGLDAAADTERSCILITEAETGDETRTHGTGIVVDGVAEVVGIKRKNIEKPPEMHGGTDLGFIAGIAKESGKVTILLDMDHLCAAFSSVPAHGSIEAAEE